MNKEKCATNITEKEQLQKSMSMSKNLTKVNIINVKLKVKFL